MQVDHDDEVSFAGCKWHDSLLAEERVKVTALGERAVLEHPADHRRLHIDSVDIGLGSKLCEAACEQPRPRADVDDCSRVRRAERLPQKSRREEFEARRVVEAIRLREVELLVRHSALQGRR